MPGLQPKPLFNICTLQHQCLQILDALSPLMAEPKLSAVKPSEMSAMLTYRLFLKPGSPAQSGTLHLCTMMRIVGCALICEITLKPSLNPYQLFPETGRQFYLLVCHVVPVQNRYQPKTELHRSTDVLLNPVAELGA